MFFQTEFLNSLKTQREKDYVLELSDIFRRANKIFNIGFAKKCPTVSQPYFYMGNEVHKAKWETYDDIILQENSYLEILKIVQGINTELEIKTNDPLKIARKLQKQIQDLNNQNLRNNTRKHPPTTQVLLSLIIQKLNTSNVNLDWKALKLCLQEITELIKYEITKLIDIKKSVLTCNVLQHKPFFYLYFCAEDRDDADIQITNQLEYEEEVILKKLKYLLINPQYSIQLKINILFPMFQVLLSKIHYPLRDQSITYEISKSLSQMTKWAELGVRFIEQLNHCCKTTQNKKEVAYIKKYMNSTSCRVTLLNLKKVFSNLALCIITTSPDDFQWLYAETYLELSESIQIEAVHLGPEKPHLEFINPATRALLAFKRNHTDAFFTYLQQMIEHYKKYASKINLNELPTYVDVLMTLLGKAVLISLEKSDVINAFFYHKNIMQILNIFNENIAYRDHPQNKSFQNQRKELNQLYDALSIYLRKQLLEKLLESFNIKKISTMIQDGEFLIFLPLQLIPKNHFIFESKFLKIDKFYDHHVIANQHITGVRFKVLSFAFDPIIKDIQHFLRVIQQSGCISKKNEETKLAELPPIQLLSLSNPLEMTQEAKKKEMRAKHRDKEVPKFNRTPDESLTITRKVTASQFGFKIPEDPKVTPIYFSKQGQKIGKPTVFVRWQGITKIDDNIELMFKKMLNPTMEGIMTVGMFNQAGAKIHRMPDTLGESWHLCGLRFKRLGYGGGWLRAIAMPDQKITIQTEDGKIENRYLFALGKAKHK